MHPAWSGWGNSPPLFETDIPVDSDASKFGDLLPPEAGRSPSSPMIGCSGGRYEFLAARAKKIAELIADAEGRRRMKVTQQGMPQS